MWFKITLAKDGAIRSCEEIAQSFEGGAHVLCIEADNKAQAIERARKKWKVRYERRIYHEHRELGLCGFCHEKALPGRAVCERHRTKQRESGRKTYAKKLAIGVKGNERVPADLDGRRDQQRQMIEMRKYGENASGMLNLRTLLLVQARHQVMDTVAFATWLQEEIDECRAARRPSQGCVECGNDYAEGYCPHQKARTA